MKKNKSVPWEGSRTVAAGGLDDVRDFPAVDIQRGPRCEAEQGRGEVGPKIDGGEAVEVIGQGEGEDWREPEEEDDFETFSLDGVINGAKFLGFASDGFDPASEEEPADKERNAGGDGRGDENDGGALDRTEEVARGRC